MKYDISKAFPYPVLRPCSDDFGQADFQTDSQFTLLQDKKAISINIFYQLSCQEIQDEIDKGNAAFTALITCRDTYYRERFSTTDFEIEASIDGSILRGEVNILCYISAVNDIINFNSPDINSEFGSGPFNYSKGNLLAQDETRAFFIDRDLFRPVSSVFDLVKKESISNSRWELSFEQDHVQIAVSPSMKEKIDNARNNKNNRVILINSLYFSATMQAVQLLKESDDFDDLKWANVIRKQIHNHSLSVETDYAYLIAQTLMKMPLSLLESYVFKETDL